jgi:hypothetical protein
MHLAAAGYQANKAREEAAAIRKRHRWREKYPHPAGRRPPPDEGAEQVLLTGIERPVLFPVQHDEGAVNPKRIGA